MNCCLVVDDSRVIRRVARGFMENLGFEVAEADSGATAMTSCQARMPDVVLLDWNMPVMDGLEFLRALRLEPGGGRPKVLFCTTENDLQHIAAALAAGADEYLMKPFDEQILAAKLEQAGAL
jgi:two-component system chemotaxis response regulator CheY